MSGRISDEMPNKAKSKAQFRLFKGIAAGSIKPRHGLTKVKAAEMVGHQSPKELPARVKTKFNKP